MNLELERVIGSLPNAISRLVLADIFLADWSVPFVRGGGSGGWAQGSHPGSKRLRNEDRAVFASVNTISGEAYTVAIVCDGVGGTKSGDLAASIAVASILGGVASLRGSHAIDRTLDHLIREADEAVRMALNGQGATTLSVFLMSGSGQFAASNVGDSRLYAWSPIKMTIQQVSIDDTVENELRKLAVKDLSAIEMRGLGGSLSQAIGEVGRSKNELSLRFFGNQDFPDGCILATDGIWKSNPEGFELCARNASGSVEVVRRSLQMALWVGGVDNASIIALEDVQKIAQFSRENSVLQSDYMIMNVWLGETKNSYSLPANLSKFNKVPDVPEISPKNTVTRAVKKPGGRKKAAGEKVTVKEYKKQLSSAEKTTVYDQLQIEIPDEG